MSLSKLNPTNNQNNLALEIKKNVFGQDLGNISRVDNILLFLIIFNCNFTSILCPGMSISISKIP